MTPFDPIQWLIVISNVYGQNAEEAARFVLRYYEEMNQAEKQFPCVESDSVSEDEAKLPATIAAKLAVHQRYWEETDDEYWKPCSRNSREEYRISDIQRIRVRSDHRGSFLVEINYPIVESGPGFLDHVYLVELRDCGENTRFVIVNQFS